MPGPMQVGVCARAHAMKGVGPCRLTAGWAPCPPGEPGHQVRGLRLVLGLGHASLVGPSRCTYSTHCQVYITVYILHSLPSVHQGIHTSLTARSPNVPSMQHAWACVCQARSMPGRVCVCVKCVHACVGVSASVRALNNNKRD